MNKNDEEKIPGSFAETAQLVESYVLEQIKQETEQKHLYYHNVIHALAVKRRAKTIFQAIKPVLENSTPLAELNRLESLIKLCATAHDMVQQFLPITEAHKSRKRAAGVSETATVTKLIDYIKNLNHKLSQQSVDDSIRFTDLELKIIADAISATICDRDPQAGKIGYSFSQYSIYQPYLYTCEPKLSVVGRIIALADLGTLGMEGVETYVQEGILIFLEDNLDLVELILNCDHPNSSDNKITQARFLNMTRFMVSLAQERQARFEREISGFTADARYILQHQVFTYLSPKNIKQIEDLIPTDENTSLGELLSFFRLTKNKYLASSTILGG